MLALNQSLLALNLQQQQQQQQMLPGLYTSIQGMDGAYAMPPDM